MENSKHTKGNWNQSLNPLSKNKQRIIQTEKALIGFVSTEEVTDEESEANAKLLASSPELLEALIKTKALIDFWIEDGYIEKSSVKKEMILIKSAIKKATC